MFVFQLALPDYEDPPSHAANLPLLDDVALAIALQLVAPEDDARLGDARERTARVPVPETTMHKDDASPGREYQIGLAGKLLPVQSVAKTQGRNKASHDPLRPRIRGTDTPHDIATFFFCECVHSGANHLFRELADPPTELFAIVSRALRRVNQGRWK